jgi:predicted neuraminidase
MRPEQMPLFMRLVLILLAGVLFLLFGRRTAQESYVFVLPPQKISLGHHEQPFFKEEFINASQKLAFVHVASIAELADHTLAALWYGGPYEYSKENTVYFAKQLDGVWLEPRAIMTAYQAENELGRPIKCLGNPLFLPNPDGSLRLLFVTIAMGKWSGSQLNSALSKDEGVSWSPARRMTLSPFFNFSELVRNRPIPTSDGWCVPIYQEFLGKFPELLWLRESDGHLLARKSRVAGGCSTLQPSLIPLDEKRVVLLLRDNTPQKKVFVSRTDDGGRSWSKPVATNLPNPDAGISGLRLPDGRLLLAYNDSTSKRNNLALAISTDEGATWQRLAMLENDPNKSFSYPYLIQSSDGLIHLAYSWSGTRIKMVSFNTAWVHSREANP